MNGLKHLLLVAVVVAGLVAIVGGVANDYYLRIAFYFIIRFRIF
mgnify:CR=1 FL=1